MVATKMGAMEELLKSSIETAKMRLAIPALALCLFCPAGRADVGHVRCLDEVYSNATTVLYGRVIGAELSTCGVGGEISSHFTVQVKNVVKGRGDEEGRIRVCAHASLLLDHDYIIAGDRISKGEIASLPDAFVLPYEHTSFYRVLSFDSRVFDTTEGEIRAVAVLESGFMDRFKYLFKPVEF
jgi:hypothetical protein